MTKIKNSKIKRVRKALAAGAAAGLAAGGAALAEGADWREALGMAAAAAVLAGVSTYAARNKLGTAELRQLVDEAVREGRP